MKDNKLNLTMLIALGIGAMIGTGIFGIPADMASVAGPFATIVAWGITGFGILMLALTFKILAEKKPDVKGGLFGFAKTGFGDYTGAQVSWGYYISAILANIAYLLLFVEVLGYFFPAITNSNNPERMSNIQLVIITSIIWFLNFMLSRGTKETATVNVITTICKIVPLILFIVFVLFAFDSKNLTTDFYGKAREAEIGSLFDQVKATMTITLWTFVGIEGIGVLSERAKNMKDVGRATILAVVMTLGLYLLVSIGSLGIMPSSELAELGNPSTAFVLSAIVGPWGEKLISVAILISISGALIGWTMIAVEIVFLSAKDGLMLKQLGEAKDETPKNAILATSILTQVLVTIAFFFPSTYQFMYLVSTSALLIPYLVSTVFAIKVITKDDVYEGDKNKARDLIIAVLATIYAAWLIYAAELVLLLLVTIVYAIGIIIYYFNQRSKQQKPFTTITGSISAIIILLSILAIYVLATGMV